MHPPRSSRASRLLILLLMVLGACGEWGPGGDVDGPRVVAASLGPPRSVEIGVRPEIVVRFSEAIDPGSLGAGSLAIVPWEPRGRCDRTPLCDDDDSCERGTCQRDPLTLARLTRLDHGDFPATVEVAWSLEEGPEGPATTLRIWPQEPLEPYTRHSLVLGAALTDVGGAPLSDDAGRRARWRRDFVTAGPGSSGPEAEALAPLPGEVAVPRNLARVDTRFARPVVDDPAATLELVGDDGSVVPLVDPEPCPGWVAGLCLRWRVSENLSPETGYRIGGGTLRDREGRAAIAPRAPAPWITRADDDQRPPDLEALAIVLRGRCVHAHLFADEVLRLAVRRGDARVAAVTGVGAIEVALRIDDPSIVPGSPIEVVIEAEDRAGNRREAPRTLLADAAFDPAIPALAIAEVLANPAGKEPQQEFVELVDLRGAGDPFAATGLRIIDRSWEEIADEVRGGAPLGAAIPGFATIPGQRPVIVGHSYDLLAAEDPRAPADALILRLSGGLGSGGLGNAGEPVTVFATDPPALVASYRAPAPTNTAQDQGRSVVLVDPEGCDVVGAWDHHPLGASSPGFEP